MLHVARIALAVLAATSVVVAPGAAAKPTTRRCPLMVDARDDTGYQGTPVGDDPALDFVSADIASDRTRLTVVMRVVELRLPPTASPTGVTFDYGLTIGGTEFVLQATYTTAQGERFGLRTREWTTVGPIEVFQQAKLAAVVDGVFDEDLSEIRMTVALKDLPGVRPGHKVTVFRLMSSAETDVLWASADDLDLRGHAYVVGTPGCVKVGG